MAKYELSMNMVMNLMKFLNKTPLEGFDQQDAMYEIRAAFQQPIQEQEKITAD
ncbi:hypothetical protein [Paenibacillus lutrae]|uniref:hypothetical protein n=1 Tax=Paenibacillus lutrae TaxID=2078573 RepID=UPI0012FB12AC|nr:hypothetical protein [Paenibacillus lutrae]